MPTSKSMHVRLSEDLHTNLLELADREGTSANALAREAIERYLHERFRTLRRAEIATFAQAFAGTELDLDPAFEQAASEHLVDSTDC